MSAGAFNLDWNHWQLDKRLTDLEQVEPSRLYIADLESTLARTQVLLERAYAAQRSPMLSHSNEDRHVRHS